MNGEDASETKSIIPVSSKWRETLLYLLIFAWLVVLINETLTWTNPQDWWGPMGIIVIAFVLVAVKIIDIQTEGFLSDLATPDEEESDEEDGGEREDLAQSMEEARKSEDDAPMHVQDRRALIMSGWIVLYPVLVFYFGFLYATPPYLLALLYYLTRDVKRTVLTAGIVLVFLYVLFVEVLNVRLYDGMLDFLNLGLL